MIAFDAEYFDGISARANAVRVTADAHTLTIHEGPKGQTGQADQGQADQENEAQQQFALADIRIQAPLGKSRRIIDLPDGGRLEAASLAGLDQTLPGRGARFWRVLHALENHLGWVMVALLLSVAAGWGIIKYAVPALAERVAYTTPVTAERELGEQVLQAMDHRYGYFKPSQLAASRAKELRLAIAAFCAKQAPACPDYRIEFRDGGDIGANALALPGGIIVVTDQLVKLSSNTNEVVAVLAHEMGHVQRRHALRQTLQGALSGLIIVAFTGDMDSLASGLPAVLLQMNYSRALETEADNFALQGMHRACIQPHEFANILQRLSQQATGRLPELLSSHPDTALRIAPFRKDWADCAG